jgi:hypothetical protein
LNALNPLSYEFVALSSPEYYYSLENIGPKQMFIIKHAWREVGLSRWLPEPPTNVRPLLLCPIRVVSLFVRVEWDITVAMAVLCRVCA